jgi:hypothetical protein
MRAADPPLPAAAPLPKPGRGDVVLRVPGGEARYRRHRRPFWHRNGYRPLWTTWHRRLGQPTG